MTAIPDITVPTAAASTAVTVTAPAESVTVPAQTVAVPAQTISIPAHDVPVPAQTVTVPAYELTITVPERMIAVPASVVTDPASTVQVPASTVGVPAQVLSAPAQPLTFNVLQAAPTPVPTPTPTPAAFNVLNYGAKADGTDANGNNFGAFSAAISAAVKAGGTQTVYAPAGIYLFDGNYGFVPADESMKLAINLPPGITLAGDGVGKTVIKVASPGYGIHPVGANNASNVGVHDLSTFVGSGTTQDGLKDGLKFIACNGVTVANVRTDNAYIGMNVIGCQTVSVANMLANNCQTGFEVDSQQTWWNSTGIKFSYCTATGTNGGGLPYGFAVCINDLAGHSATATYLQNVTLDHCSASGGFGGMYLHQTNHVTVTNCNVADATWSYYALVCKDYWFSGNAATGTGNLAMPYNAGTSNARAAL